MKKTRLNAIKRIPHKFRPGLTGVTKHDKYNIVSDSYIMYAFRDKDETELELKDDVDFSRQIKYAKTAHENKITLDRKLLIKLLQAYESDHVEFSFEYRGQQGVAINGRQTDELGMIMPFMFWYVNPTNIFHSIR